jgi:GNAT superfamily N-acetyltransferase
VDVSAPLTFSTEEELITSSGALSVYHAAIDELTRRYGESDEATHLSVEELLPPRGTFLVSRVAGHPVGGVGLRRIGEPDRNLGEVKRLWVRPDLRRHGIGAALMGSIENTARDMGYRQLYLETGYAQPEAVELYQHSGWTPVAEFPEGAFSYPGAYRFTKVL